ncbi:MAG: NAD(P)-dependent alcohol dehydrogenase [Granulosicoccus sp.]
MNVQSQIRPELSASEKKQVQQPPAMMTAVTQDRYGDAEVLELSNVKVPQPENNQILIEVDAAGVDRGVWHLMTGLPFLVRLIGFGFSRPKQPVPGLDVSGRVAALGADVQGFTIGDPVYGIGSGTFARYAIADAGKLAHRPDTLSPDQAAAASVSGITALEALRDVGCVQPGQQVLILGASGGVGTFAVQLARYFGAHVTGVASTSKLDFVRSLGAEDVVDYTRQDALDGRRRYDLILDIGGRNSVARLRRGMTRTGTLVIVGGEGGDRFTGGMGRQLFALFISAFVRQRLKMFISSERQEDIKFLGEMMASGAIVSPIEHTYRLDQVPDALRDLASGQLQGKAVIKIT